MCGAQVSRPDQQDFPWAGPFSSIPAAWRGLRACLRHARHRRPRQGPTSLVGRVLDDAGGLCEPAAVCKVARTSYPSGSDRWRPLPALTGGVARQRARTN